MHHGHVDVAVQGLEAVAVYQQQVRLDGKAQDGPLHARDGCVEDIDPVDLVRQHSLDGPCHGILLDDGAEDIACALSHPLGVIQQGMAEVRRKDDGCGEYGPGQRAPARFVAPGLQEAFLHVWLQLKISRHVRSIIPQI